MKKATRFLMAAFMLTAFVGFAACEEKPENPDPNPTDTYEESTSYEIICEGRTISAGDTVQGMMGFKVDLYLVNKTESALATRFKVEKVSGPDAMNKIGVCTDVCTDKQCPYTSEELNIPANGRQYVAIEYMGENGNMTSTYRFTVGEGLGLDNPQIIFVRIAV